LILTYVPEICKKEGAEITGSLKLQMMPYPERSRLRKEIGLFSSRNKTPEGEQPSLESRLENLEAGASVAEKIFPLIKEVDLKLKDGSEVKTADELYGHPACEDIVTELVGKYLFGFVEKN
jgi:hypothetical protein